MSNKYDHLKNPKQYNSFIFNGSVFKKHPVYLNYAANVHGSAICIPDSILCDEIPNGDYFEIHIIVGDSADEEVKIVPQEKFVFECFFGIFPPDFYVYHLNGCKRDNDLSNLGLEYMYGAPVVPLN